MEDEAPAGTRVVVFALDGKTVIGEGVIDEWVLYREIDEKDDNEEVLADTNAIGMQEVEFDIDDIFVVSEDGSQHSLEDVLEESEWRSPRILLDNGEVTYGCCCWWKLLSEYQQASGN